MSVHNPSKILVITGCPGIGDMVIRLPVLEAIKQKYPKAYLAVMIRNRPELYEIIQHLPFIDEIITHDRPYKKTHLFKTLKCAFDIRRKKFDTVIVWGRARLREPFLAYFSGAKIRIGYDTKKGLGEKLYTYIAHSLPLQHESLNIFKTLTPLNIPKPSEIKFNFPIENKATESIKKLLKEKNIDPDQDTIVTLHTCAHFWGRRWQIEKWGELIDDINHKSKAKIILTGSEEDQKYINDIISLSKTPCLSLAGQINISELAALFKLAKHHIGIDSGPTHLAAAVGTSCTVLYGPSRPERWHPLNNNYVSLSQHLPCSPCNEKCIYKTNICLEKIEVSEVPAALLNNLAYSLP
ncbi:MAG TPA: glycosyltransferase family 9 protein [Bdellovibrionota bacterium]|nr:glycosyltransferase family 9 protein [Bdellovibrionota bacterium]